jgi:hypothetical protein
LFLYLNQSHCFNFVEFERDSELGAIIFTLFYLHEMAFRQLQLKAMHQLVPLHLLHLSIIRIDYGDKKNYRGHTGSDDVGGRPQNVPAPPPIVVDTDDYYQIEAFRKHRQTRGQLQFYVKWLGYPESENSWQTAKQLQEDMLPALYQDLLDNYLRRSQAQI